MTAGDPASGARPRGRLVPVRDWSLRARLVAGLLLLLVAGFAIVGVVTELAMRDFLVAQLDDRLTSTNRAIDDRRPGDPSRPGNGQGGPGGYGPGGYGPGGAGLLQGPTPPGTLSAVFSDGELVRATYLDGGAESSVPADVEAALRAVPVGAAPRTVDLGDLGEYRVVATQGRFGAGDLVVTGLPLADVDETLLRLGLVVTAVAVAGLALTGLAGAVVVRAALRPLRRVAETARQVSETPLDRGEVALSARVPAADTNPRTEVGQVGSALNRMLGHVDAALAARQASETRVRQFVADASHELRTPLAAIRGYAELTRRSRDAVPPDVAHALGRVESESARMTTLVDDLLLLARLDAGHSRALAREPVDLSMLVVDATSDAHAAGREHRWQLDLPPDAVVVTGDDAQLHHVVGNLLANARTHTPPGTTVRVGLATAGADAVLTVADDGPGIPARLVPEVFDRFARGDSSRSRAAGSTGLGLAIVAAVVQAHHGTVAVTSEPGATEFTVRLPLATG